jgi:hypothetical protein
MAHVGLVTHYGDDFTFSIKESGLVAAQRGEIMKIQSDKQTIRRDALSLNRRALIKALGLGAAAIMLPAAGLLSSPTSAQVTSSSTDLITRRIPLTNEVLPGLRSETNERGHRVSERQPGAIQDRRK